MGQLKNATDSEGATPLHRAIERKDIVFVELLLGTHGIDWTIKDNTGETPMDLLAKLCDELPDWVSLMINLNIFVVFVGQSRVELMHSTLTLLSLSLKTL